MHQQIYAKKSIAISIIALVILFSALVPAYTSAQFTSGTLRLEISPPLPGAYEEVRLRVEDSSTDLDRADISWFVNDILEQGGTGEKNFAFTTSSLGSISRIDVVIRPVGSGRITRSVTIRPVEIDIVWQAVTYTPPFYKGKALVSSRSLVVFSALPGFVTTRGKRIGPSELIYTWNQDGVTLGRGSGLGKKSIVLEGRVVAPGKTSVTVTATTQNGDLTARQTIEVATVEPKILFYEKHPLEGVRYNSALGKQFTLTGEEVTVRAEPFYFSLDNIANNELEYKWKLNREKIQPTGDTMREVTLRRETGQEGTADLNLKIENVKRLLQFTKTGLSILFGTQANFIFR